MTLRIGRYGEMTTSARKNQNGIKKAKTRASTGCVTANSKAIAVQRNAASGDERCVPFMQYLGDSMSVEDFQNLRVRRRLGGSVDISIELTVDNVHAHAFSVLINSGAIL
jgi:hypothetical protein